MHSYASLLSLSPPAPHTRTHPHSSTISFTAETDRGEAEWIKVRFDTRGYILLPNHDQASSLAPHSLPGLAEWATHRLWAMQNLRGGTWLCVFSMFCHTWGFSNPQSTTSRLASMRSVACRASYQRVQRIVVQPHPGKRSPSTSATSQTSLTFHLLWNVVRMGHNAINRNLFI